jgi:hypothetical protein
MKATGPAMPAGFMEQGRSRPPLALASKVPTEWRHAKGRNPMKAVEAVCEILKREGIEVIIGYPVNHVLEYAARADIRPVIVRQERVGLHMADAMSRLSSGKTIGVFAMQHGPGSENAYGGVAQAYGESVPMLVLPMGYPRRIAHIDPNYNSTISMKSITKSTEPVVFPQEIPNIFRRAFSKLRNPIRAGSGGTRPRHGDARQREEPGDLCGAGRPLRQGVAAAEAAGRTARNPGLHQPRRQERVSGEP